MTSRANQSWPSDHYAAEIDADTVSAVELPRIIEQVDSKLIAVIRESIAELADEAENYYDSIAYQFQEALTAKVAKRLDNSRFNSDFRHEVTPLHGLVYAIINTVGANVLADEAKAVR